MTTSPLGAIPLGAIPLGAITVTEVCAAATGLPTCDADTTLGEWSDGLPAGTDLNATPLGAIPIEALPLGAIPLGAIDLTTVQIAGVPLGAIPLGAIDLVASPLGAIPLGAIGNVTALVDCTIADCTNGTLSGAATLGAIADSATLGTLIAALDPGDVASLTLAGVLDHLTLAFLGEVPGLEGLTLGDLIVGALLGANLPWEEFPLETIEVRDVACGYDPTARQCSTAMEALDLTVTFSVVGAASTDTTISILKPPGFLYLYGSSDFAKLNDASSPIADPLASDTTLQFRLGTLDEGTYVLRIALVPGFDLQTVGFAASDGKGAIASSEAVSIVQNFEPNDVVGTATTGDVLYVSHVADGSDVDAWRVPAPGVGYRVSVFLSNLDGDTDLFMYRPAANPVSGSGSERTIPLGGVPIDDDGADTTGDSDLTPEVLADTAPSETAALSDSSANRSAADETVTTLQHESGISEYTIEVTGYNGASSTRPYVLRVAYQEEAPVPVCTPRAYPALVAAAAPVVPPGTDTVFLTNPSRMSAIHGDTTTMDAALASVSTFSAGGVSVNGAVVDIAGIPGVAAAFAAWDSNPCDPEAANSVVGLIAGFVQDVAASTPTLRHVSIVGSDEVVPFHRVADTTVVANESTYIDGFEDNALFGALSTAHYLSDAAYGDLDPIPWLDRFAYIPDLAVGRLVETPDQIEGALDAFVAGGGLLTPETASIAAYDFLSDGGAEVDDALSSFLTSTDTLINETWTRRNLVDQLGLGNDIASPNAHYDHHRGLPAAENLAGTENDLFTIGDLTGLALANRIVFTMGCHTGLNVDGTAGFVANPTDWAEVYTGFEAIYIGNTGYGYGDSSTVALTEKIVANLAERLDGRYTIGQALADAKQDQFGRAGLYGVYDLKAIEEATLYGLPFWQIAGPGSATVPGSETGPIGTEPVTGLDAAAFTVTPTFDQVNTGDGTFFVAEDGAQFLHWRPLQPLTGLEVAVPGSVATGVLLTDLESRDLPVTDQAFGRPATTDLAGREPEVESEGVIFPTNFATLSTFNQINPETAGGPVTGRQRVNLIPGQYVDEGAPTQRLFDSVGGLVHYVDASAVATTDFTPPAITSVNATVAGDQVVFDVEASDPQSGISRVLVLYRSSAAAGVATWTPLDLSLAGGVWQGGGGYGPGVSPPLDYIVQVVNGDGVVGVSTFKRGAHRADVLPTDPDIAIDLDGAGVAPWFRSDVTVTLTPSATESFEVAVDDGLTVPYTDPVVVTGDGVHIVRVASSGGAEATVGFVIDITAPTVTIEVPVDGAVFGQGDEVAAEYTCTDVLSTPSCTGPVPPGALIPTAVPGVHVFGVEAVDEAGNTTTIEVTYTVEEAGTYDFEGFLAPLDPDPTTVNVAKAGRTVPIKFRLYEPDGTLVTDTTAIASIDVTTFQCDAGLTQAIVTETLAAGQSGLVFVDDHFQLNWATLKAWRGTCRAVTFTFADGSESPAALFRLR
ncbi:MAG: PxKF domain-containing protein [Acidimicrobiia bacterium]|nr:PxKF domain-containing protein [Acidimicrobiia bacterium]